MARADPRQPIPRVLVVGTADTKADELEFLCQQIERQGAAAGVMDVGVLGEPRCAVAWSQHDVAHAAGSTNAAIVALGDENRAMSKMAAGASALAQRLHQAGEIHAMIAIGGTMGTDLALDVAMALPLGVPKTIVSTVAFSPLIPAQRIAPDLVMALWAGGLYGLNSICRLVLGQAAAATVAAMGFNDASAFDRPLVGVTSFGKSAATWMLRLVPELAARGYEASVFHATGMGGQAFEALAAQRRFAAVMDFAVQEVTNEHFGSMVSAGPGRLLGAGRSGVPQIVAPGFIDLVDWPSGQPLPPRLRDHPTHAHNRLLLSISLTGEERREAACAVADKLRRAASPTVFLLPLRGLHEWDRPGGPLHNADGIQAVNEAFRDALAGSSVLLREIDAHINDAALVDAALESFDRWVASGVIEAAPAAPPR